MTDFSKLSDGEINRLVAEALGWTGIMEFQDRTYGGKYFRGDCPFLNENGDLDTEPRRVPEFTTDPAAWWPLVELMQSQSKRGIILRSVPVNRGWICKIVCGSEKQESFVGRAVCLCFLKWKATEGGK